MKKNIFIFYYLIFIMIISRCSLNRTGINQTDSSVLDLNQKDNYMDIENDDHLNDISNEDELNIQDIFDIQFDTYQDINKNDQSYDLFNVDIYDTIDSDTTSICNNNIVDKDEECDTGDSDSQFCNVCQLICPGGWWKYIDQQKNLYCFLLTQDYGSWSSMKESCKNYRNDFLNDPITTQHSIQSSLAILNSSEMIQTLNNYLHKEINSNLTFYVGLIQDDKPLVANPSEGWRWIDGKNFDPSTDGINWGDDEPNDSGGTVVIENSEEDYGEYRYYNLSQISNLNDIPDDDSLRGLCMLKLEIIPLQ